jgi:hypothetical protein
MPLSMIAMDMPDPEPTDFHADGPPCSGIDDVRFWVFGAIGYTADTPRMSDSAWTFFASVRTATPLMAACVR